MHKIRHIAKAVVCDFYFTCLETSLHTHSSKTGNKILRGFCGTV